MMIEDLVTKAEAQVKTFDVNILTGAMGLFFVLLDEIHLLGNNPKGAKVLRQIRGGLDKTPEGLLVMTTTQSDDMPLGIFKSELKFARNVRDGKYRGRLSARCCRCCMSFRRHRHADARGTNAGHRAAMAEPGKLADGDAEPRPLRPVAERADRRLGRRARQGR
jgi:hypothetical protein